MFKVISFVVFMVVLIPFIVIGYATWIARGGKSPLDMMDDYFDWLRDG